MEYPELKEFVKSVPNVTIIRPQKSFKEVLETEGYPVVSKEVAAKIRKLRRGNLSERYRNYLLHGDERGKFGKLSEKWKFLLDAPFEISEKCCDEMKHKPFRKYFRKTGRLPYLGITQDEGFHREHQYSKTGCNVYDAEDPKSQPLAFWRHQDILRYLYEHDEILEIIHKFMRQAGYSQEEIQKRVHPWASCYGDIVKKNGVFVTTGVQRTGCMFCAFGCHLEEEPNRFQRMEKTHPELHKYCIEKLGMGKVLEYINVPYKGYVKQLKDYEQVSI